MASETQPPGGSGGPHLQPSPRPADRAGGAGGPERQDGNPQAAGPAARPERDPAARPESDPAATAERDPGRSDQAPTRDQGAAAQEDGAQRSGAPGGPQDAAPPGSVDCDSFDVGGADHFAYDTFDAEDERRREALFALGNGKIATRAAWPAVAPRAAADAARDDAGLPEAAPDLPGEETEARPPGAGAAEKADAAAGAEEAGATRASSTVRPAPAIPGDRRPDGRTGDPDPAPDDARQRGPHYHGTYRAGLYCRREVTAGGVTFDRETIANLPNWLSLDLRLGEDAAPFALDRAKLIQYRHLLDVDRATTTREMIVQHPDGRRTRLRERRLVSLCRPDLMASRLEIHPLNWSGRIGVDWGIDSGTVNANVGRYGPFPGRTFATRRLGVEGPRLIAVSRTLGTGVDVVQAQWTRVASGRCTADETHRSGTRLSRRLWLDCGAEGAAVETVHVLLTGDAPSPPADAGGAGRQDGTSDAEAGIVAATLRRYPAAAPKAAEALSDAADPEARGAHPATPAAPDPDAPARGAETGDALPAGQDPGAAPAPAAKTHPLKPGAGAAGRIGSAGSTEGDAAGEADGDEADGEAGRLAEEALRQLASAPSFEALEAEHAAAWAELWRSATPRVPARHMRRPLMLHAFHVLQAAPAPGCDSGIPARGWHGEAYQGHAFWDEIFVLPYLSRHLPDRARAALLYRYRRLGAARAAAAAVGMTGAMYPWRSASDGREVTPRVQFNILSGGWMADHTHRQRHVGAAIAYGIWDHLNATGDEAFLEEVGAEMILEIARFFACRAEFHPGDGRYHLRGVVGPDEYHDALPGAARPGLDDNAYTNLMAVWTICRGFDVLDRLRPQARAEIVRRLGLTEDELATWDAVSRRMTVVFHGDGVISQFRGYETLKPFSRDLIPEPLSRERVDWALAAIGQSTNDYQVNKQADTLTLFYLLPMREVVALLRRLGYDLTPDAFRRTARYYLERSMHRSSLSRVVYAGALAECDPSLSRALLEEALGTDLHALKGESIGEGIHLGAMGGTLSLAQRG